MKGITISWKTRTPNTRAGFTIVELLIVIVVIAILAAITIVAYTGIQERAEAAAVQSDLSNAAKKLKLAKINATEDIYPSTPDQSVGITASRGSYQTNRNNFYYCATTDGARFAMTGITKSGEIFSVTSESSVASSTASGGDATCSLVGAPTGVNAWTPGLAGTTWQSWVN
tara:strand:- start:631 stop:1143 length:513 start_codon:yes stop_codon:yes gene_type:complete